MKIRKGFLGILLTACLGISLLTTPAQAVPMSSLLFAGDEIIAVDKRFYDWNIITPGPFLIQDFLEVQPLEDDPLNPGLRYLTNTHFPTFTPVNFTWSYKVKVLSDLYIIDNSLELDLYATNGSELRVIENVWTDTEKLGPKEVFYDNGLIDYYDEIPLPPSKELYIETTLIKNDFSYPISFEFEQRFSQTPEPTTMLLLGSGLVGLVGLRRKFRKK